MEEQDDESETAATIRIMEGMRFYDTYIMEASFMTNTICTYRNREQVLEAFGKYVSVVELIDPDDILDSFNAGGIYCVELHNTYKNLKSLAEDLVVSRISGMMDKEI